MKFKYRRFVSESSVGSSSSSIRTSSTSEESDNDDCANISDEIDDENYNHPHDNNGKLILIKASLEAFLTLYLTFSWQLFDGRSLALWLYLPITKICEDHYRHLYWSSIGILMGLPLKAFRKANCCFWLNHWWLWTYGFDLTKCVNSKSKWYITSRHFCTCTILFMFNRPSIKRRMVAQWAKKRN